MSSEKSCSVLATSPPYACSASRSLVPTSLSEKQELNSPASEWAALVGALPGPDHPQSRHHGQERHRRSADHHGHSHMPHARPPGFPRLDCCTLETSR